MPTCEGCGESFGNEGALSTHERFCDELEDGDGGNPSEAAPAPQPPAEEEAQAPVPAQQQQAQQQEIQAQQGQSAIQTGMEVGEQIATMGTGSAEEQAQSKASLAKTVAGAIASIGETTARRELEGIERSKNATEGDLQVADDYVSCPDCEKPIKNLPEPGTEFNCPHCGTLLRSDP